MIEDITLENCIVAENNIYYKNNNLLLYQHLSMNAYNILNIIHGEFNIYYFVEGKQNDFSETVYLEDLMDNKYCFNSVLKNNENELLLRDSIYKLYTRNYYRILNKETLMIKGSLSGYVNIKDCGDDINISNMVIHCYRSDDKFFIGEYPIVDWVYTIPNLDVNTYYNLVIVDKSKTLEQKILSYRKPTAY